MIQQKSLADQAVFALSAVSRIGDEVTNDDDVLYAVRGMKRIAEDIIGNALRQAMDISYQAQQLQKDWNKEKQT